MEHLHYQLDANPGDVIEVMLDHAANVLLLDASNYANYTSGQSYRYHGGYAKVSPYRIRAPHSGRWHLAVDLGGGAGSVRASVQVVPKFRRIPGEPAVG
jgi:hypothetical protein